ncbi:MAG: hypothetical protein JSW48_05870 [Betaproteobacteria bacterium]|nr:MAG: hypothetical protein JSW48_05870 [Betaproteobacteria bacterium]
MGTLLHDAALRDAARHQKLLISDAEAYFCASLAKAGEARSLQVLHADNNDHALELIKTIGPDYVVIEQGCATESLDEAIQAVRKANINARCIVVSRYPSIASAVRMVKQGAWNYISKPTTGDVILDCFLGQPTRAQLSPEPGRPMSVGRLEWEHIQRMLQLHQDNISATARALGMHRRTLQRKLSKYPALR